MPACGRLREACRLEKGDSRFAKSPRMNRMESGRREAGSRDSQAGIQDCIVQPSDVSCVCVCTTVQVQHLLISGSWRAAAQPESGKGSRLRSVMRNSCGNIASLL